MLLALSSRSIATAVPDPFARLDGVLFQCRSSLTSPPPPQSPQHFARRPNNLLADLFIALHFSEKKNNNNYFLVLVWGRLRIAASLVLYKGPQIYIYITPLLHPLFLHSAVSCGYFHGKNQICEKEKSWNVLMQGAKDLMSVIHLN